MHAGTNLIAGVTVYAGVGLLCAVLGVVVIAVTIKRKAGRTFQAFNRFYPQHFN